MTANKSLDIVAIYTFFLDAVIKFAFRTRKIFTELQTIKKGKTLSELQLKCYFESSSNNVKIITYETSLKYLSIKKLENPNFKFSSPVS